MNEASAILDLHSILGELGYDADSNQEMFAKAFEQSSQIANFTTSGPLYIMLRSCGGCQQHHIEVP
jgi:hypothetical protein